MKIDRWSRTVSRLAPVVAASAGLAASSAPAMAQESASNRGLEIAQTLRNRVAKPRIDPYPAGKSAHIGYAGSFGLAAKIILTGITMLHASTTRWARYLC